LTSLCDFSHRPFQSSRFPRPRVDAKRTKPTMIACPPQTCRLSSFRFAFPPRLIQFLEKPLWSHLDRIPFPFTHPQFMSFLPSITSAYASFFILAHHVELRNKPPFPSSLPLFLPRPNHHLCFFQLFPALPPCIPRPR